MNHLQQLKHQQHLEDVLHPKKSNLLIMFFNVHYILLFWDNSKKITMFLEKTVDIM